MHIPDLTRHFYFLKEFILEKRGASYTLSGNTLRVSYHLCIRHTLGKVFKLYQSSENASLFSYHKD